MRNRIKNRIKNPMKNRVSGIILAAATLESKTRFLWDHLWEQISDAYGINPAIPNHLIAEMLWW